MAGNNSIQFLRGTSTQRATHTETSLAGQPIFETDTGRLFVGNGQNSTANLLPVKGRLSNRINNVNTLPLVPNISFEAVTFNGLTSFSGKYIWSDGKNIYYSLDSDQYVLDKTSGTWTAIQWSGLQYFNGNTVWSDGIDIYVMDTDPIGFWRLTDNNTFVNVYDCTFNGQHVWTDGVNIYYDNGSDHYRWNRSTMRWVTYTPQGMSSFYGNCVWSDGVNIRYSNQRDYDFILNKETNTWVEANTNYPSISVSIDGNYIFSDGQHIIGYSTGDATGFYYFDRDRNGFYSGATVDGLSGAIDIENIWSDGESIYYSNGSTQLKLKKNILSLRPGKSLITYAPSTNYWEKISNGTITPAIGDTKTISISGSNYQVRCIGINHDDLADGSGKARTTWEMVDCLSQTYQMNTSATNIGGWNNSYMRHITLSSTGTIFTSLPSDLKPYIKTVIKKTANGGSTNYSGIVETEDKLFLLSAVETFGTTYHDDTSQYTYTGEGYQYEFYSSAPIPEPTKGRGQFTPLKGSTGTFYTTDTSVADDWVDKYGGARNTFTDIRYNYNCIKGTAGGTYSISWWLRSASRAFAESFCCGKNTGDLGNASATNAYSVSFCFCI